MRCFVALLLSINVFVFAVTGTPDSQGAIPFAAGKTQPIAMLAPSKTHQPNAETSKQIAEKTQRLRKAIEALKAKQIPDDVLIEVEIYLKAAENIVRFDEWFNAASGGWALTTLDQGLERAGLAAGGRAVWRDAPGQWVHRAYRSQVDGSIQPYAVLLPADFGKAPQKKWRLDVVLHGRDGSLTESKFIATHNGTAPKDLGYIQLEVYGRGNNAYRWAGEADVFEAQAAFMKSAPGVVDLHRVVLRGFSMGGAGTWHLGLHHPSDFCVIGPGAGFTNTHGYVANLPKQLPEYQEKCLRIYDAVEYAENVFNVPVVAYSGANDTQKKAADNIENALKGFKEPHHFTHLIAPGLKHQMPRPWQEKAHAEYRKYADPGRELPERVRFVTYTPRYGVCDWVNIHALNQTYQKALLDASYADKSLVITTGNIRRFDVLKHPAASSVTELTIDGTKVKCIKNAHECFFEQRDGEWIAVGLDTLKQTRLIPDKHAGLQGPIDDAFLSAFKVVSRPGADTPRQRTRSSLPHSTSLPGCGIVICVARSRWRRTELWCQEPRERTLCSLAIQEATPFLKSSRTNCPSHGLPLN